MLLFGDDFGSMVLLSGSQALTNLLSLMVLGVYGGSGSILTSVLFRPC